MIGFVSFHLIIFLFDYKKTYSEKKIKSFCKLFMCVVQLILKSGKAPLNIAMTSICFFVITIGILLIALLCHLSLSLSVKHFIIYLFNLIIVLNHIFIIFKSFYRYHLDLIKRIEMTDIELKSTRSIFLYYKTFITVRFSFNFTVIIFHLFIYINRYGHFCWQYF